MSFQRRDQFMEIGTALGNSLWDLMSLLEGFCSLLTHVPQEQFDFGTFLHQQGFSNHAAKIKCSFMMEKRYTCHRQIGVLIIWFATEIRTAIPLSLSYMWRKNVVFFKKRKVPTYAIRQYFRNATSSAAKRTPPNHVSELMPCNKKNRKKKIGAIFEMIIDFNYCFMEPNAVTIEMGISHAVVLSKMFGDSKCSSIGFDHLDRPHFFRAAL